MKEEKEIIAKQFGLIDGQFFAECRIQNQRWYFNGEEIGFGDLRTSDIERIMAMLVDGEIFEGFNQHHGSPYQQRENPCVIITPGKIEFPKSQPVTPETRRKNHIEWRN